MLNTAFAPWPSFTREEADAAAAVILSNRVNYWTGEECRQFEVEFAAWAGTKHAIALANGTVALDLALHGLGIGAANGGSAEDEVIVTPRTFLASVSCVINAGARPVFADVGRDSGNLTAETIASQITRHTKAVIAVHLAGWPCDMDPIMELAEAHRFFVIEDCAQAHGARYKGRSVGSIGHVGAWSFCQDKIMSTAGEGGMITCNDDRLWTQMWSFKDHGKSWEAVYERQHPPGFRWLHESIGTNWRMTEVQGAIGRIQLRRMADWTAARLRNSDRLRAALAEFCQPGGPVRAPLPGCERATAPQECVRCVHASYKFYFYVEPSGLAPGWNRDRIVEEIVARGVPAYQGSCSEVYLEKAFEGLECRPEVPLPVARELGETSVMMLVHPTLTEDQMELSCTALREVLAQART
ncbi:DegT/DnrJ/EryC1/StrS aminotransferase family protein [Chakrabartia godavariana]|nr:DegT/DnrJ/EryC1/StrS aminotransferase family protein [Chakrabartia godavariana]